MKAIDTCLALNRFLPFKSWFGVLTVHVGKDLLKTILCLAIHADSNLFINGTVQDNLGNVYVAKNNLNLLLDYVKASKHRSTSQLISVAVDEYGHHWSPCYSNDAGPTLIPLKANIGEEIQPGVFYYPDDISDCDNLSVVEFPIRHFSYFVKVTDGAYKKRLNKTAKWREQLTLKAYLDVDSRIEKLQSLGRIIAVKELGLELGLKESCGFPQDIL